MAIVSTTLCYPNRELPTQGIFVQRRLAAVSRLMPLAVVAPIPWFPVLRPGNMASVSGEDCVPPAMHPRMFYLPGIAKSLDAAFYARALLRGIGDIRKRMDLRLIDAHFEWPDAVGAFLAARKLGLPVVCTLRGKLVSQSRSAARRRQIIRMLRGADALISVSRSLADLAEKVADCALKIRVIPNGIDAAVFHRIDEGQPDDSPSPSARSACGWSDAAKYVVSVGHLQLLKGYHRLIEVWPQVRRRVGDVRLILVGGSAGEPSYEQRLRRLVDDFRLTESVVFTGRVDPARVSQLLNAADLFVLASRSEGCCNAIAEALACGCPVVATDVGGNGEQICESALGRLVSMDRPERWAAEICGVLQRPWDRRYIAAAGGRRDWQQVAAECVDVFKEVLGG